MQRVICGYQRYKGKNQNLLIYEPDSEVLYLAQDTHLTTFDECIKDGIWDEPQMTTWMYEKNYWNETKEHKVVKQLPDLIEDIKIDMYNNSWDELKIIQLRSNLKKVKLELLQLYSEKHQYDYTTANGVSNFMKNYTIVENSVKLAKTKEQYDWADVSIISLMGHREKNTIMDEDVRNIAKYSEWKGIWYSAKTNGNLFGRASCDMTSEQKRLVFWSAFYDNVGEHPECPPDKILEDDDIIDGWVAIQRRKKEKEKAQQDTQKKITNSKIQNSSEIFIVARDEKHANDIESLNSPQSAALKQARVNQIIKNQNMKDSDFKDVKAKIMMDAVNKGNEIMRGK